MKLWFEGVSCARQVTTTWKCIVCILDVRLHALKVLSQLLGGFKVLNRLEMTLPCWESLIYGFVAIQNAKQS